jgi:hypothetical protein
MRYFGSHGWQTAPSWDLTYSISSAIHAKKQGTFTTYELHGNDLGAVSLSYLTKWPPGMGLIYFALLQVGARLRDATILIGVLSTLAGGIGWLALMTTIGSGSFALCMIALLTPWLPFVSDNLNSLNSDLVIWCVAPWTYFLLLRFLGNPSPVRFRAFLFAFLLGMLQGSWLAIKYSAFPHLVATAFFFYLQAPRIESRRTLVTYFALGAASLPCALLAAYVAFGEFSLFSLVNCPVTLGDAFNLLESPIRNFSGFAKLEKIGWVGRYWPSGIFALALVSALAHLAKVERAKAAVLLAALTIASVYAFYLIFAVIPLHCFRWKGGWDTQYRYFSGVMPLVIQLGVISVSSAESSYSSLGRLTHALVLLIPVVLSAVSVAAEISSLQQGPHYLPRSGMVWYSHDRVGADWLKDFVWRRRRKPDVLFAPYPELMNEFDVPVFTFKAIHKKSQYYSSRPLEVWVFVHKDLATSDSMCSSLLAVFRRASRITKVKPPSQFPFAFWLLEFNRAGQVIVDSGT